MNQLTAGIIKRRVLAYSYIIEMDARVLVMLNEKAPPFTAAGRLSDAQLPVDPAIAEQQKLVGEVEVTSLKIEQDPDIGSDPYNCTGQYCVVDIIKDR